MSKEITIQGFKFEVDEPYKDGDTINANEAAALNQTYAENVRNNFAGTIKAMKAEVAKTNGLMTKEGDKEVPDIDAVANEDIDQDALNEAFDKYVESYEFGARRVGGARVSLSPVEAQAHRIAWEKIKPLLVAKGYKIASVDKDTKAGLIAQALEKFPEIMEAAEQIVEQAKGIDLAGLQI